MLHMVTYAVDLGGFTRLHLARGGAPELEAAEQGAVRHHVPHAELLGGAAQTARRPPPRDPGHRDTIKITDHDGA